MICDVNARREFHGLIHQLSALENTTILITTHNLDEAEKVADRIVVLDEGRIVADGPVEQLAREFAAGAQGAATHGEAPVRGRGGGGARTDHVEGVLRSPLAVFRLGLVMALTGRFGVEYRRDTGLLPDTSAKFGATSYWDLSMALGEPEEGAKTLRVIVDRDPAAAASVPARDLPVDVGDLERASNMFVSPCGRIHEHDKKIVGQNIQCLCGALQCESKPVRMGRNRRIDPRQD